VNLDIVKSPRNVEISELQLYAVCIGGFIEFVIRQRLLIIAFNPTLVAQAYVP
jgi:hypothetical protein